MSRSQFTVSSGVVFERVVDELMIVVPGHAEVVKLTGEAADAFRDVQAGGNPHASGRLMSDLEALGIIESSGMSRRGLIKAGAIGAGAGIAVMAMPGVASASSGGGPRTVAVGYGGMTGPGVGVRDITLGGWSLIAPPVSLNIPDGTSAVFNVADLEMPLTISGFDSFPWITIPFSPDAPRVSFAAGNTATITLESLNLVLTYTFADGDV